MLLTISNTHAQATDLGYLFHKHPDRCMAVLLLDEDPIVGAPIPVPNTCGTCGSGASAAIMSLCILGTGRFRLRGEFEHVAQS